MLAVDPQQALAFRVAGHNLHRRTDAITAIAACGLQNYPPGWVEVALHARTTDEADPRKTVTVNAMRGAPYLVPSKEVAIFTAALLPADEDLRSVVNGREAREAKAAGYTIREALDAVADAARDGLAGGPLGRDEFHQALRERLPEELLPWCRGCESHHVRPGFWRTLGLMGVTRMDGRARYALAKPAKMPIAKARDELARRFLRCFGPASHTQLASWAQTAPAHAKALLGGISEELEQVELGGAKRWLLAEDVKRLSKPPKATGVRMLGGHDPYVGQPDRETLVPDRKLRTRMFPAIGRPGVILDRGRVAGLWKGRKQGSVLAIEIDWLDGEVDLGREPNAIARARGCEGAEALAARQVK